MGKNRDKVSIIAAVLEAANKSASKTHIMHTANLSYKLLEKYLETTLQLGFINRQTSRYELTFRGREFLNKYRQFHGEHFKVQELLSDLENERKQLERQCQENTMALQVETTKKKNST